MRMRRYLKQTSCSPSELIADGRKAYERAAVWSTECSSFPEMSPKVEQRLLVQQYSLCCGVVSNGFNVGEHGILLTEFERQECQTLNARCVLGQFTSPYMFDIGIDGFFPVNSFFKGSRQPIMLRDSQWIVFKKRLKEISVEGNETLVQPVLLLIQFCKFLIVTLHFPIPTDRPTCIFQNMLIPILPVSVFAHTASWQSAIHRECKSWLKVTSSSSLISTPTLSTIVGVCRLDQFVTVTVSASSRNRQKALANRI
jgi:hypothetical protein